MNTRQHNPKPVEHTLCVSGLSGRPGQGERTDRGYLDTSSALVGSSAAAVPGLLGLSAVIAGFGPINPIA
ncbi:MAG: hypothetical protein AAGI37_12625 [Planctomycetota bacterium]